MATNSNPNAPTGYPTTTNYNGHARYARQLKANGQYVACFATGKAKGTHQQAINAYLAGLLGVPVAKLPTYVAYNYSTMQAVGFAQWAPCYAATMAMAHTALAPSVASSLGKQGLAPVATAVGQALTVRPRPVEVPTVPTPT